jgi:hypothetical protein
MSVLLLDGVARIEVRVMEVAAPIPPHSAGGDVRLDVRLQCDGFTGSGASWIARDTWLLFLEQLERLDNRREGEAVVESMSPDDLRLRIFATDRAGHVAIDGQVRTRSLRDLRWQFGAIRFDPTLLAQLLSELRADGAS